MKCKYISFKTKTIQCSSLYNISTIEMCPSLLENAALNIDKASKIRLIRCKNSTLIEKHVQNDFIPDCLESEYGSSENIQDVQTIDMGSLCSDADQIPCSSRHAQCFNIEDICVYKLTKENYLTPCKSGEHMEQCEHFDCNKKYKCLGYYCVPFAYTCDGRWDCPGGYDENFEVCGHARNCNNMFHCRYSQICIHNNDVCDRNVDCPLGDDEILCDFLYIICPEGCLCYNLVIQCFGSVSSINTLTFHLPHTFVFILHTAIKSLAISRNFLKIIYLSVGNNRINSVCDHLSNNNTIIYFDANNNILTKLWRFCFYNLSALEVINLSTNTINKICKFAFIYVPNLKSINLGKNFLNEINTNVLENIIILDIRDNPLLLLKKNSFQHTSVKQILTDNYHICCLTPPSVSCNAFKPWYESCSKLLPNSSTRVLFIVISFLICFLNMFSIYIQINTGQFHSFKLLIISVNCSDLLCSFYLIILLIADFIYQDNFVTNKVTWRSSVPCTSIFILSLMFSFLSTIFLTVISVCRCIVVVQPLNLLVKKQIFY